MTQQEFETRTKVNVNAEEFETINNFYMSCEADKDEFCKMWCKMNAGRVTAARLAAPETAQPEGPKGPEAIDAAEAVITAYLAREIGLRFQNDKPSGSAYYSQSEDKVVVPMLGQYDIAAEYYSTTFHELTHSTLKASRCNREGENTRAFFGNADYSREELVAEMGAAMLVSHSGIDNAAAFRNSVAYIQNWMQALKNDPKMIVWAASRAEKAARYIIGGPEAIKPQQAA